MAIGFERIGGYHNLEKLYFEAVPDFTSELRLNGSINTTCGVPRYMSNCLIKCSV